ncbi:hypothetical protein SODALDRAFT_360874 [Sodiomyces alkalinus F11]|uniref:Uncharacterized protein n=1 Tax=Sodiomyces alkalinus (strain CBS 110278 / VKM F-3762 / F11) TaxID=1314773 RepID=A0A3N2PRV5_SODAK|nr:hypothetical protein SODALDRAFT_360874 [Sodiomyces alkalinus F11]ROT37190.1 hypothetical protein SODALDRAFT_360874 [Sodiomyces alkalinus F11]
MGKTIAAQAEDKGRRRKCAQVVGEVGEDDHDDDDSDTQGVGLSSSTSNKRFVSDPLQFTGIEPGDRAGHVVRRGYAYEDSGDEDEDEDDEDDDDEDEDASLVDSDDDDEYGDGTQLAVADKEEALVQAALARIRRAQERGKQEVKLNKQELAALERRRRRLQEEEEARRANERKKRKQKKQRIAIPLSQLDPTATIPKRKSQKSPAGSDDNLHRHASPANVVETQQRGPLPPMGYFPPPNTAARSRPRSSTSASQRPPSRAMEEHGSSPLQHAYPPPPAGAPISHRHVSDTTSSRPRSSRSSLPPEEAWVPHMSPASAATATATAASSGPRTRSSVDPFAFQTEGPRAPYSSGAGAVSQRHTPSPAESRRASIVPAAARGGRGSRRPSPDRPETDSASETSDPDTSDDLGNGVQIVEPPRRGRRREEIIVEEEPAPSRRSSRNKKPVNPSPVKKKSSSSSVWKKKKK